jgi:hypothetical protein
MERKDDFGERDPYHDTVPFFYHYRTVFFESVEGTAGKQVCSGKGIKKGNGEASEDAGNIPE